MNKLRGSSPASNVVLTSYNEEEELGLIRPMPEKNGNEDATDVMTLFDSEFDDAEAQQAKFKSIGECGTAAQAFRRRCNSRECRRDAEKCMCMNQRCCNDVSTCQSNWSTCAKNGFNCVEPDGDIEVSDVCNSVRYTFLCIDEDLAVEDA